MLHLVQSNKMERLAEDLLQVLAKPQANPLTPHTVLVQSPGMAQWLKIKVADSLGIAANLNFPLPSSYIWQLYQQHVPDLPQTSAFTKANMAWKLYRLIPTLLEGEAFAALQHYLSDGPDWQRGFKTFQLAEKIADIFDQYLVYRPDWIQHWESGQLDFPDGSSNPQSWQPLLWQALIADTRALQESHYHRANLHQRLIQALVQQPHHTDKPVHVFGLSAMPVQQLQVLAALAQHQEVFIYWCNPSDGYWGDLLDRKSHSQLALRAALESADGFETKLLELSDLGNPLLAAWGKLGRDYLDMLLEYEHNSRDCFDAPDGASLLGQLQREVFDLTQRGSVEKLPADELLSNGQTYPKFPVAHTDKSLQIRACHSKVRELEVLKDQLLFTLDAHPDWSVADIIVMMPDVSAYAPYIDAVFGGSQKQGLPYAISDRSAAQESGLIQAFLMLMSLHQSRIGLSDVLDLLEVPAVAARFEVDEEGFRNLKHWLEQAGVRWSLNGEDKQRWQLPLESQNTLAFGLQRLLSGYAMQGVELMSGAGQDIAPYSEFEGQQAQVLGQGMLFATALQQTLNGCLQTETLEAKVAWALDCVELFFSPLEADEAYLLALRQALEGLTEHQHQYTEAIEQDVFVHVLEQALHENGVGQRFLAGNLNFCTLMPMRSIPFKQVCLLGMNESDYPRQVVPVGFDLMQHTPTRRGDRSRRLDDRYLFLEAIMSARDSLYISYIGRSQQDNSERLPSLLISELLDYCQQSFALAGQQQHSPEQAIAALTEHLVNEEALQPFHSAYFDAEAPTSFAKPWLEVALAQQLPVEPHAFVDFESPLTASETALEEWDLEDWLRFWDDPIRYFFEQRWHIRFEGVRQAHEDAEPFALDELDRYRFSERYIQSNLLEGVDASDLLRRWQREGILPPGEAGAFSFSQLQKHSSNVMQALGDYCQQSPQEVFIEQTLGQDLTLSGWLGPLYSSNSGDELVLWRPGRVRGRDKWRLWLCLLGATAQGNAPGGARFVGSKDSFVLPPLAQTEAKAQLQVLGQIARQGLNLPLLWLPESAWVWMESGDEQKVLRQFYGDNFQRGEVENPYLQRVCPALETHMAAFVEQSEALLSPVFAHINEGDD